MSIAGLKSFYHENKTRYQVATEAECEKIIESALRILEETGLAFKHERALAYFREDGCRVEKDRVYIPPALVKKAINSAAKEVVLYDRFGNVAIRAGGANTYFGNGPTNPFYNEFETGKRREARKQDVAKSALVSDALPNIDFIMSLAGIMDWSPQIADVCEMHEMLQNTTKPIVCWGVDVNGVKDQLDMCAAVAGSWEKFIAKPFLACYAGDPVTPLVVPGDAFEKLEYCAKMGVAVIWPSGAQLGTVTPVTIASAVTLGLAENLAALTLTQLINEGTAFVGAVVVLTVDMVTTQSAYGSPEHCLGDSLVADVYHYLNLPTWQTGGATDAKVVDEQAAIETAMQCISNVLSGGNLVHDVGFMDGAMTSHLDMITLADEVIGYARRVGRGVEINDETIALPVIQEVGPGGEFLTHEHTYHHFRNECWQPTLLDRSRYQNWIESPSDMRQRIHQKTEKILAEHQVPALPDDVIAKLDAILEAAQKRLVE